MTVLLLLPPFSWLDPEQPCQGRFHRVPALAMHIFAALRSAGLGPRTLLLDRLFHGRTIDFAALSEAVSRELSDSGTTHVVVPISDTESYNEFVNVDLGVLRRILEIPSLARRRVVVCGRVLSESALREAVPGDYQVVPVSYDEGRAVVEAVRGGPPSAPTRIVWDEAIEEAFHLEEIFAERHPDSPVVLVGQRGCPYRCSFCERVMIWPGTRVERSEPAATAEAMRFFRDRYARRHFMLLDPIFNLDDAYVSAFCDQVGELGVRWHVEMRVNRFDPAQVHRMREAGCYRILLGIESLDEEVSAAVGKPIDVDAVRAAVDICQREGIQQWLSFILGLGRSVQLAYRSVAKSAVLVRGLELPGVDAVPYFMYTGTRAYRERFGRDGEGAFPKWYLPFPLVVMADLMVLFANLTRGYSVEVGGQGLTSFLELTHALAAGSVKADRQLVQAMAQHTSKQGFFRALFHGTSEQRATAMNDLLQGWKTDQPCGRHDFAAELRRYNLPAPLFSWP